MRISVIMKDMQIHNGKELVMWRNSPLRVTILEKFISNTNIFFSLIVIMVFLFTSCQATPHPSDQLISMLRSSVECIAPCWQTLTPGQSTEEEFLKLVEVSPSKRFDNISHGTLRPEGIVYSWDDNVYKSFNQIRIYKEQVRLIGFQPRNRDFTPTMIENILGSPSSYGASQLGVEKIYIELSLIYEEIGVVIETWTPVTGSEIEDIVNSCEFEVDWEARLEKIWIYFVEPNSAKEMVKNDPIGGFKNPTHRPQPWTGENPIKLTLCP